MKRVVDQALDIKLPNEDVLAHIGAHKLTRQTLRCFLERQWLTCEPIDAYMELLQKRAHADGKKIIFLPTHFYSTLVYPTYLMNNGMPYLPQNPDPFTMDKILIPINQGNEHWVLLEVDMSFWQIWFYDPSQLRARGAIEMQMIAKFFTDLSFVRQPRAARISADRWDRIPLENIPRQEDSCNCGVYVLTYAERLARGIPLDSIEPSTLPKLRIRILSDILTASIVVSDKE